MKGFAIATLRGDFRKPKYVVRVCYNVATRPDKAFQMGILNILVSPPMGMEHRRRVSPRLGHPA